MYVLRSQQLSHISFVTPVGAMRDFLFPIQLVDELIYSLIVDTDGQYCTVLYCTVLTVLCRTVPYQGREDIVPYGT
jgi:hypothetical protein